VTTLPVLRAAETNMLEAVQRELPWEGGRLALTFRPFEIKTVRLMTGVAAPRV
jgi:alpha-mannosidase